MALIQQLQKFNLDLTKLHELSEKDIIRIEKQFKAEVKLNDSLDMNDLEQVIQVIRHHKQDMIWLMSDELKLIKSILTNPEKFFFKKGEITINTAIDKTVFSQFLETYFSKELRRFIDNCIKNEFYNSLHSLLKFQSILTPQLLDEIQQKLTNKLSYAVECVAILATDISKKISYCTNPFFYRVLSQLGSGHYENLIIELLNTTINKLNKKKLHWEVVFAMGSFVAQSESLKNTLRSNKSTAFQHGVRETKINRITGRATGGASSSGSVIRDDESRKGNNKGLLAIFFVIAIIVLMVFSIGKCQRKKRIDDVMYEDYWAPSIESDPTIYDENVTPFEDLQNKLRDKLSDGNSSSLSPEELSRQANDFESVINYLHSDDAEFLVKETVPFEIDATQLNNHIREDQSVQNVHLINFLDTRLVIQSRSLKWNRYHVVEPADTVVLSYATIGLKFYIGEDPIIADYIDENGETKSHFMFAEVTEEELEEFNNFHNLVDDFDPFKSYEIPLIRKDGEIVVNIIEF